MHAKSTTRSIGSDNYIHTGITWSKIGQNAKFNLPSILQFAASKMSANTWVKSPISKTCLRRSGPLRVVGATGVETEPGAISCQMEVTILAQAWQGVCGDLGAGI